MIAILPPTKRAILNWSAETTLRATSNFDISCDSPRAAALNLIHCNWAPIASSHGCPVWWVCGVEHSFNCWFAPTRRRCWECSSKMQGTRHKRKARAVGWIVPAKNVSCEWVADTIQPVGWNSCTHVHMGRSMGAIFGDHSVNVLSDTTTATMEHRSLAG